MLTTVVFKVYDLPEYVCRVEDLVRAPGLQAELHDRDVGEVPTNISKDNNNNNHGNTCYHQ